MSARQQVGQQTGSFLVRCWVERREVKDQPEVLRVYVRNLRTGEEHYISDPAEVGQLLQRSLGQGGEEAGSSEPLERSEAG